MLDLAVPTQSHRRQSEATQLSIEAAVTGDSLPQPRTGSDGQGEVELAEQLRFARSTDPPHIGASVEVRQEDTKITNEPFG